MSADSTDPAATAKNAQRDYPQTFDDEHDIELARTFWHRKHDPWIAYAAVAASLLLALTAVYWMPLPPPS
jgi:hypothetical protein